LSLCFQRIDIESVNYAPLPHVAQGTLKREERGANAQSG
jgi:hypothetical protein